MTGTEKLVTLKRLTAMLDAYGAEPDRWPEQERSAALALIDNSSEARSLFDEACALDALLDSVTEPSVSPALTRKVRTIQPPESSDQLSGFLAGLIDWLHPGSRTAWQGAVAAAAIFGIVVGIGVSEFAFDRPGPPQIAGLATTTTASSIADPSIVLFDDDSAENDLTLTVSLGPDITQITLTGSDGANDGSLAQVDDSEMAVASIPLY